MKQFYKGIPWATSTMRDGEKPFLFTEAASTEDAKKKLLEVCHIV